MGVRVPPAASLTHRDQHGSARAEYGVRTSLAPLRNGLARGILAAVVAATTLFLLGTAPARADFHLVGDTLNVDGTRDAVDTSIADISGVPYVAWRETTGILGGLIFVKRFDGTSWVQVGGSLNVDATMGAAFPRITSVGGVPYVTWKEAGGGKFQIRVARFNGTTWEPVGASLNIDTAQAGSEPSIASVGGVPYVAWAESIATVNRDKVHVRRLNANGTTWDVVGTDREFRRDETGPRTANRRRRRRALRDLVRGRRGRPAPGVRQTAQLQRHDLGAEHTIFLVNTPQCLMAEGLGDLALSAAVGPGWGRWLADVLGDLLGNGGPVFDPDLAEALEVASRPLNTVRQNAAIMLHDRGVDPEDVIAYQQRWSMASAEQARQRLRFMTDPLWRAYTSTYVEGDRLLRPWLEAGDPQTTALQRFQRLLDEPLTPAVIQQELAAAR